MRTVRIGSILLISSALIGCSAGGGGGGGGSGGGQEPAWVFPTGSDNGVEVAVSADGAKILAGGGIFAHLLATSTESASWSWESTAEYEIIDSVVLSRDGSRGVVSGEAVYAFDDAGPAWTNEILYLPGGGYTDAIGPVDVSEDGSTVIGAGVYLTRYAGATGSVEWIAQPHSALRVAISRDGSMIAADLSWPGLALFGAGGGDPIWTSSTNDLLDDVLISPDGTHVVAAGDIGVACYGLSSGTALWTWTPPNGQEVVTIAMPGSSDSVIAGGAGFVARISVETGKADWIYEASLGGVFSVDVTEDGERIAVGSDWGVVTSLNGRGKVRWIYDAGGGRTTSVSLSDDGRVLAAGDWNDLLVFLD